MEEHRCLHVFFIELLFRICQKDNGELKPFALVNCHNTHDILTFAEKLGRRQVNAAFLHFLNKFKKAEKPSKAGFFILPGTFIQSFQISLTRRPVFHSADIIKISRIIIYAL